MPTFRLLETFTLGLLIASLSLSFAASQGQTKPDGTKDKKVSGQGKKDTKKPKGPAIPRLGKDELPKQTRVKLDASKTQHVLPPVYVHVTEQATLSNGKMFVPEVPVVRNYLAEYFRRAGHPVVDDPGAAKFRIEGDIATTFEKELKVRGEVIAWKYIGDARIDVIDDKDRKLETVEFPEVERLNVKNETSAIWDLRRYLAYLTYQRLFTRGEVFTNADAVRLLGALTVDPFESEFEISANEVIQQIANLGLPAVPYLLDALGNTEVVLADADYPGLENPQDLKVYHIADKALEEIFQKVSRMGLKTPNRHRFIIIRGWEGEWRRFCKAFRESPEVRRREDFLHRKSEGQVDEKNFRVLDFNAGDKTPAKGGKDEKPSGAGKPAPKAPEDK